MKVDLRAALHIGLLSAATVQLFLGKFNYNLQEYLPRTQIVRIFLHILLKSQSKLSQKSNKVKIKKTYISKQLQFIIIIVKQTHCLLSEYFTTFKSCQAPVS